MKHIARQRPVIAANYPATQRLITHRKEAAKAGRDRARALKAAAAAAAAVKKSA